MPSNALENAQLLSPGLFASRLKLMIPFTDVNACLRPRRRERRSRGLPLDGLADPLA